MRLDIGPYVRIASTKLKTSNHRRCSLRKGVLKNLAKFKGKHLCQALFFNEVAGLEKRLWYRYFPVNFAKFLRTHLRDYFCKKKESQSFQTEEHYPFLTVCSYHVTYAFQSESTLP